MKVEVKWRTAIKTWLVDNGSTTTKVTQQSLFHYHENWVGTLQTGRGFMVAQWITRVKGQANLPIDLDQQGFLCLWGQMPNVYYWCSEEWQMTLVAVEATVLLKGNMFSSWASCLSCELSTIENPQESTQWAHTHILSIITTTIEWLSAAMVMLKKNGKLWCSVDLRTISITHSLQSRSPARCHKDKNALKPRGWLHEAWLAQTID